MLIFFSIYGEPCKVFFYKALWPYSVKLKTHSVFLAFKC